MYNKTKHIRQHFGKSVNELKKPMEDDKSRNWLTFYGTEANTCKSEDVKYIYYVKNVHRKNQKNNKNKNYNVKNIKKVHNFKFEAKKPILYISR